MIQAVIFDMDGLMFDTEALSKKSWLVVGREMKLPITDEILHRVIGMNAARVEQECMAYFGPDFDYHRFRALAADYMSRSFDENGVPVKRGLRELLAFLRKNRYKTAVASSSSRATVEHHLKATGLESYFDTLVCGDMVKQSKPAPDIFLKAAEALGVKPQNCLVLEDSANGIRAAHAAGIPVIMVPDLIEPTNELRQLAWMVCESLCDVLPVLEQQHTAELSGGEEQTDG
ncbi:MAG: HAD family phosphatase [Clostridiales bacterium]|nr:MAG: HAD family phosphatase [Clostridiales bacterium]